MRTWMVLAIVLGLSGAAGAQEGKEKERKNKDASIGLKDLDTNNDGRAQASELQAAIHRLSGSREGGERRKERREEGSIPLKDVDTNNDGRVTMPELTAALEKTREGGERKEGGDRKKKD